MARLYKHGTELERWTKCGYPDYVFMSDGKVLISSHGHYKIYHPKNLAEVMLMSKADNIKFFLSKAGYTKKVV
jgi:hypothetical protein